MYRVFTGGNLILWKSKIQDADAAKAEYLDYTLEVSVRIIYILVSRFIVSHFVLQCTILYTTIPIKKKVKGNDTLYIFNEFFFSYTRVGNKKGQKEEEEEEEFQSN